MKITIEIDQKTTQSDVKKLIEALQSVYVTAKPEEEKKPNIQKDPVHVFMNYEKTFLDVDGSIQIPPLYKQKKAVQITKEQAKDVTLSRLRFEPISKVYSQLDIPFTKGWLYHQIYDKKISYRNKIINGKKISCINKVEVEEYLKSHLDKKSSK